MILLWLLSLGVFIILVEANKNHSARMVKQPRTPLTNLTVSPPSRIKQRYPNSSVIPAMHPLERIAVSRVKADLSKAGPRCNLIFLGDSIVFYLRRNATEWNRLVVQYGALNLANPGDKTEHLLYRLNAIQESKKNTTSPRVVAVMIGTNNIGSADSAESTFAGISLVLKRIKSVFKGSKFIVWSILPRGNEALNKVIMATNEKLRGIEKDDVKYLDVYSSFLSPGLFESDKLHLNFKGSHRLLETLEPFLPSPATPSGASKLEGQPVATGKSK